MFGHYRLPILATVPRSGTWFLRYVLAFLCHLDRGGRVDDRLTGEIIGDPAGPAFDFEGFRGGPLFDVQGALPARQVFVGHTVCPGFQGAGFGWWRSTRFHLPGYDYFGEGHNYRYTPVDLSRDRYTAVPLRTLRRSVRDGSSGPIVLVYRNPLDQAASYYRYCCRHRDPVYSTLDGRPLGSVGFEEYLFGCALPSYARQLVSFQVQARRHPGQVLLMPYERLVQDPVEQLRTVLDHLAGRPQSWPWLAAAVALARGPHLRAIERELGRSLDGTRIDDSSHITRPDASPADSRPDPSRWRESLARLSGWGIDVSLFVASQGSGIVSGGIV